MMNQVKYFKKNGKLFFWTFVFLLLIIIDQFSKSLVVRPFKNFYFAFSLPLPKWLMFAFYGLVLIFIIKYCLKHFKNFVFAQILAWLFIVAGAVSNIGERMVLGYVRDYIYIWTGVFNLADGYIIVGILILLSYHKKTDDPSKN